MIKTLFEAQTYFSTNQELFSCSFDLEKNKWWCFVIFRNIFFSQIKIYSLRLCGSYAKCLRSENCKIRFTG